MLQYLLQMVIKTVLSMQLLQNHHTCKGLVARRNNSLQTVTHFSARNKDQKLVGHFLKIRYFADYYIAVTLKMFWKYGRSK